MIRGVPGRTPRVHPEAYVDPAAQVIGDVTIDAGASVWPFTVLRGDQDNFVKLGRNSNVQDNSVLHVTPEFPCIVGDNVTIGAGAAVLGGFTIGAGSRIGAGSVVVREVPENCVVVGVPGRITFRNGERVTGGIDLNQTDLPDPLARTLEQMADRIHSLEAELERLKKMADAADARTH